MNWWSHRVFHALCIWCPIIKVAMAVPHGTSNCTYCKIGMILEQKLHSPLQ